MNNITKFSLVINGIGFIGLLSGSCFVIKGIKKDLIQLVRLSIIKRIFGVSKIVKKQLILAKV